MARNFGSPLLQRPGAMGPNDPRRKRLPLTPEEDPYGGIVPDLEVDLPELASPLPQAPLTQPPVIGTQTGAKLPMEQWQTPPQDLTALRAWYSGAAKVPGAPAAPEWGKQTPTYSRLHPPPPKPVEPLPAPRVPVVQPNALGGFGNVGPASVGQALQGQMQGQMQQAAIQARQPVATRPTLGQPAQPQVAIADRQRFTLAEAERRALQQKLAAQGAGQYLQEAGMGDLRPERFAEPPPAAGSGRQALNQLVQSFGTGLAGIPRGVAAALEETLGTGNVVPENWRQRTSPITQPRALSQALQAPTAAAQQGIRQAFPVNPQDQSWLTSKIPSGLGSAGAFTAAALAGRALGVPANVTTATAGTGMSVDQFLNEVEQSGIDPKRYTAGVNMATVSGLSELVGFGRILDKFGLKRSIIQHGLDVLQDAGQEAFQGYLEDLNAKYIAANDPTRNVDPRSADFWLKRGEEAALGAIISAPMAGISIATERIQRPDGGVNKVPDALQSEIKQRYDALTDPSLQPDARIPRAPLSYAPGVPSQQQGPGFIRESAGGATTVKPQGPPRPQRPAGLLPPGPTSEAVPPPEPTAEAVEPTVEQPEEQYQLKGEWPVSQTYLTPVQLQMRQKQGPDVSDAVGMGLEDLQAEYKQKGYFTRAGKRIKNAPTPRDVQGEEGNIPQMMYKAPNLREFIDKGGAAAYGVKPTDNAFDAYERIAGGVASEMTELTGEPYSIDRVQKMGNKEWGQWFDTYGKARGLDFTRDLQSILEPTTGKQMGAVMPGDEFENLFGVGGKKAGQAERGQVQAALQEDIAKLFGMPFNKVSLTQVTPTMWRQWAAVRRISPEGLKGIQRSIKAAEEYKSRTSLTKKESALRDERKTQPVSEWYEKMYGRPSSLGKRQGPPPAAPTTPVTPSPTPPPAPPAAPSAERGRYLSQVQQGLPRAPLAFQPRSYTQGVASIEEARRAREEARQARERLKKQSPFAKAREAERDIIEGRRPEPPVTTEPVTPKPTPPAPPAPAGEGVTPKGRRKAATPAPEPVEQTGKEMVEELFGESQRKQDAFDSINPDLPNSMAGYIEQFGTKAEKAEYAELQALEAKAKAARERKPGDPQSGFGRVSQARRRALKEKIDSLLPNLGAIQRARTSALKQEPIDAATVDKYGIKLPKGYVKQGNQYVYQKGKAAPVPETTKAKEGKVKTAPQEVKQVFATLDTPSGKKTRTRNIIKAEYPEIGAKAIFVNDNIEQIIAEAEANGKVTKECP